MKKFSKAAWIPKVFLLGITLVLSSCKKYLDKSPLSDINPTQAFQNYRNFQGFAEELYNCIPLLTGSTSHNNWNFGDDEYWEPTDNRIFAYQIDQGNFFSWTGTVFGSWFRTGGNPSNNDRGQKGNLWGTAWYGIRKANIGLANLELMKEATDEEKKLIEGQLYFFRGWLHFMLLQYWGGLPYVDVVIPADETPKFARLNYHATAEKVNADLQKAADLLPINWDETTVGKQTLGSNNYRANKIMALAFMAKNMLLAGSPLMNQESTGSSTYNTEYCKKAADVFAQTLKLIESTGRYKLAPFSQYSQLFYTQNQSSKVPGLEEAIFVENLTDLNARYGLNQINDYRPNTVNNSGIKCYPTANYLDYYGMANGLPIIDPEKPDPASGYDPEFPWKNRDPRFYNDVMIDGEKVVNDGARVGNNEFRQYASLYTNGFYRIGDGVKSILTGYMFSKFCPKLTNDFDGFKNNVIVALPLMRLADVYLMYAEAVSEGYNSPTAKATGYDKTAVDAVNMIRDRAGVGRVASKFLASQDAFRPEYRRERAVELAFEGHRFVDLRRWLLLTQRPYTLKKSVEFDRATPNSQIYAEPRNARVKNYRETVLFERQYAQRHYWFPFQTKDVSLYGDFKQNPGW